MVLTWGGFGDVEWPTPRKYMSDRELAELDDAGVLLTCRNCERRGDLRHHIFSSVMRCRNCGGYAAVYRHLRSDYEGLA